MGLRSPLGKVLGSGSAKDGTEHWWLQRVTAVALLILGCWFLTALLGIDGFTRPDVLRWAGEPWNGMMLVLFTITLAWHSSLGVQVVIEDYVHAPFIKVVSLMLNRFVHVFVAIASVFAVFRIGFGAAG